MTGLPPLSEETVSPGTALTPYDRTVSAADVEQFLARTGERAEDYRDGEKPVVPTGMLMGLYGPLIHGTFHYEAGVHVSSELTVAAPPLVGEQLHVAGEVLRLFERNGHRYVTFSVEVSSARGELARVEHTSIYSLRQPAA